MTAHAAGAAGARAVPRIAATALLAVSLLGVATGPAAARESDPAFSVSLDDLAAGLDCPDEFVHADREPVLLVHGTGTRGPEQYDWNYLLVLPGLGFDVCTVTYPDRGLGDQQVSAEYIAHAVMAMHAATGRKVDVVGHSQGASMPRWAVKFWPSVRNAIDDYVGIAGPYHGLQLTALGGGGGGPMPASFHQFSSDSNFVRILNEGDETPGDINWTNLYSEFDLLVQPVRPVPTSALDFGQDNPRVANILLQDLCPGRVVDHLTIGTTDRLAFDLVVDALVHDGPADPARLGLGPACSVPDQIVDASGQAAAFASQFFEAMAAGFPDLHLTSVEPTTMPYALASAGEAAPAQPPDTDPAPGSVVADTPASTPATGGGAALLAVLLGLLATRRLSHPRRV